MSDDESGAGRLPMAPSSAAAASASAAEAEREESQQQAAADAAISSDGKLAHTLHLDAQWTVHTRDYTFRPLLHNPTLAAFTRHRHYNAAMLVVMVSWGLIVFQPFLKGWGQVGLMIAFELLLILPVFIIELTRIDRSLFLRLVTSFDWLWLIGNHIIANVMRMLIAKHQPSTPDVELAYLAVVYVVWLEASLYGFSLDALVGPSHRFRIVWMVVFILQVLQFYIQYQLNRNDTLDLEICVLYCSTAQSLLSASMLNVMIFSTKYCLSLIRHPKCLMIIAPRCKLTVEGGPQATAEEMQRRAEEALNQSPLSELQTVSSSAQL